MPTGIKKQNTYKAEIIITGTDSLLSDLTVLNSNNFSNFIFTINGNNLINFNSITGEVSFFQRGYIDIEALINAQALQASAEFFALLEINKGSGWEHAPLRKEVLVAIEPSQILIKGNVYVEKNHKIRICTKKDSGNIDIITEYINGDIIPAAVINFLLYTKI
jgi:hypothetical protein